MRQSLYKYFIDRKWAEAFLDGEILFRSLSYFRDLEDGGVRNDKNEGVSVYRPEGGLVVNNMTQGTKFTLPGSAFESRVSQEEIFVYCTSKVLSEEIATRFKASAPQKFLSGEKINPMRRNSENPIISNSNKEKGEGGSKLRVRPCNHIGQSPAWELLRLYAFYASETNNEKLPAKSGRRYTKGISRRAPTGALFRKHRFYWEKWCARSDSNTRPCASEAHALSS